MSHEGKVLNFLKENGSITPRQALRSFQNMRLASCINRLRNKGWPIHTCIVRGANQHGRYCYARYTMARKRRKAA